MSRARLAVWAGGAALLVAWLSSAAGTMPGPAPAPTGTMPGPAPAPPPVVDPAPPAAVAGSAGGPEAVATGVRRDPPPRLRPAVRNPFTLAPRVPAPPARGSAPVVPAGWAPSPAGAARDASLPVSLAGIAADETPSGPRRTAVLTVDGQVLLARVGDEIPGPYQVRRIDADAVELFDPGRQTALRLRLP